MEQPKISRAQVYGLSSAALALFLIAIDMSAFAPALPAIENEFGFDITTSQWVINGYALVFGILVVTGGRLADIFGRKRAFMAGTGIFALCSLLGGLSIDMAMLLVVRCLMGIGAALMWPSIIGMTYSLVSKEHAGQVGGGLMAILGLANIVGPIAGGVLAEYLSWRWIFYINIPLALTAILLCWKPVPDDAPTGTREKVDYLGVITLSASLFSLLISLNLASEIGFRHPLVVYLLMAFLIFICLFIVLERRNQEMALVPADIITNKTFCVVSIVTLLSAMMFFAVLLFMPQFFIEYRGFTAVQSGFAMVPLMATFALTSYLSGALHKQLGAKILICVGLVCKGAGIFSLSYLNHEADYLELIPGLIILGIGIGLFNPAVTTVAVSVVDSSRSSLASAILYMFKIAGGALGLGINATIVAFAPDVVEGISRAYTVNAYFALSAFIIAVFFVPGPLPKVLSGR
ncbi:MFS transporter [Microbulbifer variabilis]|uniref:MFS transporter n=1 Tax=Microbulbifer variabilis TaxID=266805 RepID=UPI001CFD128B|nr:MFS transporter [Microbulbifer variabilis]